MVSVSVSGVSTKSKSSGKIAPETLPLSTLWTLHPGGIDPPPPAPPSFKCKCKRCIKSIIARDTTPTSEPGQLLKLFKICEKLYLNDENGDSFLQIYTGEDGIKNNLILTCQRVNKKSDSSIIFIDHGGRIILQSERDGRNTKVSGESQLGTIGGSPGDLCSFRRHFSIRIQLSNATPNSPNTVPEKRLELKAIGCCAKALCCSFFNSFYLEEFLVLCPERGEIGSIRRAEGKGASPTVQYYPSIQDDDNVKGLILAAAVTLYELFMQRHLGFNMGSVGRFYSVAFGIIFFILASLGCMYQVQVGAWAF